MTALRTTRATGYQGVPAPLLRPEFARSRVMAREKDWQVVRLVGVEIEAGKPTIPAGHQRLRTAIRLGRLTPADVQVRMTTARAFAADVAAGTVWTVRLLSAQAYGNGTYVFEGHVPERVLEGPERLVVLIERRRGPDEPTAPATPVVRWMLARPPEMGM